MEKSKRKGLELVRFLVCGLGCALLDYLFCQLSLLLFNNIPNFPDWLKIGLSTAVGFIVGVICNYFISTYWVYQNVDKKENTKKPWFIALFVLFSFIAFLLSWGTMELCNLVTVNAWNINIGKTQIFEMIKQYGIGFLGKGEFWAYFVSFFIKTLVGLVFNYFTRKYILYKAPKED